MSFVTESTQISQSWLTIGNVKNSICIYFYDKLRCTRVFWPVDDVVINTFLPLYHWLLTCQYSAIDHKRRVIWDKNITDPLGCALCANLFSSSLQSRRNFGGRVLSIFLTKIMTTIFDFNGSGRLGRERNLYQRGCRQSKIRRGVHSNSKSNMAGRMNDRELIKLARPDMTPSLQASLSLTTFLSYLWATTEQKHVNMVSMC